MHVLISYTQKYIVITESVGFWMQPLSSFEFLDYSLSNFAPKMSKALLGTTLLTQKIFHGPHDAVHVT